MIEGKLNLPKEYSDALKQMLQSEGLQEADINTIANNNKIFRRISHTKKIYSRN